MKHKNNSLLEVKVKNKHLTNEKNLNLSFKTETETAVAHCNEQQWKDSRHVKALSLKSEDMTNFS